MQMFDRGDSRGIAGRDNVLLVSDGRVADTGSRWNSTSSRPRPDCTSPAGHGMSIGSALLRADLPSRGNSRTPVVPHGQPVASEVATDARHGRLFFPAAAFAVYWCCWGPVHREGEHQFRLPR